MNPGGPPARTLPDLIGPSTRLLFVGVNPGLSAVAAQAPFPLRSNRFFRALHDAGITDRVIDTSAGWVAGDREYLLDKGIGITALVPVATAQADDLTAGQLRHGVAELSARIEKTAPAVAAFLGITAYRVAFSRPRAIPGRQPHALAAAQLWVVPNPSGRNLHASPADLAAAYRDAAVAADIDLRTS